MRKVIIDTDAGIDDAMALLLALASPELEIVGITTVSGNVHVDHCTKNVLHVLELAGRTEIPVFRGAERALLAPTDLRAVAVHGPTGLGPFTANPATAPQARHAVEWIIETLLANPGEIEILALGPVTNVALAIATDRRVTDAVSRVVYMGGVTLGHGNVGPISTFNVTVDAEATQLLLRSGVSNVVQVGQDVTRHVRMRDEDDQRLAELASPVGDFLHQLNVHGREVSRLVEPEAEGHAVHDVVAATYVIDSSLFESRFVHMEVALSEPLTRGATIADYRPTSIPGDYERLDVPAPNCHVCLKADRDRIIRLYLDRIQAAYGVEPARVESRQGVRS